MAGRTLLDIVSGGRVKHTGVGKYKGLPGAAPTVPALFSQLYESMAGYQERGMSEEVFPAGKNIFGQSTEPITQGNLYEIAMGGAGVARVSAGVVKTASTAGKLLSGWSNNLRAYMAKLSKKELKKMNTADNIIRDAIVSVQKYQDDIQGTLGKLSSINKKLGLNKKVTVPRIEGAAGGAMRQATKKRGAIKKAKEPSMTRSRKEVERKAKIAKEKQRTTGDEPYSRLTQKLDK